MAKKFNFRLDPVLKLRNHEVSVAKQELNDVLKVKREKEDEIDNKQQYYRDVVGREIKSSTAANLQARIHHLANVENELDDLNNQKERINEIEEFKRLNLNNAMKEEKVLEKLKSRRKEQYLEESLKEENQTFDEIALRRHGEKDIKL